MGNTVYQPHKSSLGVDANLMAVACYGIAFVFSFIPFVRYFAWLAPLVIFFLEKSSVLVKFHAVQALILNAIGAVLSLIVSIFSTIISKAVVPNFKYYDYTNPNYYDDYSKYLKSVESAATVTMIFGLILWVVAIGIGVLQIMSALKAYKYSEYKLPIVGGIANKVSEKLNKVDFGGAANTTPPPSQTWTPPAQVYTPPAQQWSPPAAPPAAPPAQPIFDTETGLPITPPAAPPAQQLFDTETGLPITPPAAPPAQQLFDTETGLPINPPQ